MYSSRFSRIMNSLKNVYYVLFYILQFCKGIVNFQSRVIGGWNENITFAPHHVVLQLLDINYYRETGFFKWEYNCGGSLIQPSWVLTAGHCSVFEVGIRVVAGFDDISKKNLPFRSVKYVYKPAEYDSTSSMQDIALLKLAKPFNLSESVKTIELIGRNDKIEGNFHFALAVGFGSDSFNSSYHNKLSTKLGAVNVELEQVDDKELSLCRRVYGQEFDKTLHICGFWPSKYPDLQIPCYGDSGGGLIVVRNDLKQILIGIVSYVAQNCSADNSPSFSIRITVFLEWISDIMLNYKNKSRIDLRNYHRRLIQFDSQYGNV